MKTSYIVIAVIGLIVIGGVAAFLLMDDGNTDDNDIKDDGENSKANFDGRLKVFGNANNDDWIDEKDLTALEDFVKNKNWDQSKNPFADANHDKVVDEKDIEVVKSMIKRVPMEIWYQNVDGVDYAIDYPIGNIITIGSDAMRAAQILDMKEKVVGRNHSGNPDLYLDPTLNRTIVENAAVVSPSTSGLDMGLLSNLLDKTTVDVILTGPGKFIKEEKQLDGLGIHVIRMGFNEDMSGLSSFLTMGYLGNKEQISHDVVDFYEKTIKDINDKLATIPDDKRVSAISMFGGGNLACNDVDSYYGSWILYAGAKSPVTREMTDGEDGKKVVAGDSWHLGPEFDVDYIVYSQGSNYRYTDKDIADIYWDKYVERFAWDKMTPSHFPNSVVFINWNLYPPLGYAYLAGLFYPEVFGADYGDKVHQEWCDKFYSDLSEVGYKVTDHAFCVGYEDLKDYVKV